MKSFQRLIYFVNADAAIHPTGGPTVS